MGRAATARTLVLLAGLLACHGSPSEKADGSLLPASAVLHRGPRNVVLITVDTLRRDATGFSGSGRVETPNIDRLAEEGVVFRWTHAHAVVTLPSHASILTGLYPFEHGIRDNAGFVLSAGIPTLATLLKGAGYATAAFVSAAPLDRRFGLDHGFDVYDDDYDSGTAGAFVVAERPDAVTVGRARDWWRAHAGERRLLWLHLFGPHFPYEPAEPFASRYAGSPYFGEVAQTDARLAELLTPLLDARDEPTLVVLTADHGESLGEHGEHGHGLFAYEPSLRVPLVFWAAGMLRPGSYDRPARHVDLLPTILDLLDLDPPDGLPGRRLFSSADEGLDDGCYFESLSTALQRGWAPLRGRLQGTRKAIRLPIPELYDLSVDPQETTNLVETDRSAWEAIVAELPHETQAIERGPLGEEMAAKLRSLGYVSGAVDRVAAAEDDVSKDPKNLVGLQQVLNRAGELYRGGDFEGAVRILEDLAREHPELEMSYSHLAQIYLNRGRAADAVRLLRRAESHGVSNESLRTLLALAYGRQGEPERARAVLSADDESNRAATQWALARIALDLGRTEQALERYERTLRLDPSFPEARLELGLLLLREKRFEDAETQLETALARLPGHARGWNALGVARAERGDPEGAAAAWKNSIRADPKLPDPRFNLARVLLHTGRSARAAEVLRGYLPLVAGERRRRAEQLLETIEAETPRAP